MRDIRQRRGSLHHSTRAERLDGGVQDTQAGAIAGGLDEAAGEHRDGVLGVEVVLLGAVL